MDEGHDGVCESGVNDVGGRIAVGTGSIAPHGFDALTGHTPLMEELVPGWVRMPNGGWQFPVSCPGVYRVCCAFGVGQQSVRGRLCFVVGDEYVCGGNRVVELCVREAVCDLYFRAFPIVLVVF